jgi:hypothetical protein
LYLGPRYLEMEAPALGGKSIWLSLCPRVISPSLS